MKPTRATSPTLWSALLLHALGCGTPAGQSETGAADESTAAAQSEDSGTTQTPAHPTEAASDAQTATVTSEDPGATSPQTTTGTDDTGTTTGSTDDTGTTTGSTDDTGTTDTTGDTDNDTTGGLCLPECRGAQADDYADCMVSFDPAPATVAAGGYNHDALPQVVLGPPGAAADVVSLGCGGQIVLAFAEPYVVDGPGADLIVFENPFNTSFPEPGRVEVSADGCTWSTFPCDPVSLAGCAGKSVTKAVPNSGLDPTDPAVAGGDAFDLAAVGLDHARYLRIVDVSEAYWSAMNQSFCDPGQGGKGGFDLNAVAIVHGSG